MDASAHAMTVWARRGLLVLGGMAAVGAAWAAYDLQTAPAPFADTDPDDDVVIDLRVPIGGPAPLASPVLGQPTMGQPTMGQPTMGQPTMGQPALA